VRTGVGWTRCCQNPKPLRRRLPNSALIHGCRYLSNQVLPVVARLLIPIPETNSSLIAECLGLDGTKFAHFSVDEYVCSALYSYRHVMFSACRVPIPVHFAVKEQLRRKLRRSCWQARMTRNAMSTRRSCCKSVCGACVLFACFLSCLCTSVARQRDLSPLSSAL